jgi:hypothetical protein
VLLDFIHSISDGQATSVKEGTEQVECLSRLFSYLVDMCRPGKPSIKGHPEISCRFDPHYCLGLWMRLIVKSIVVLLETLIEILQSRSQCSSLQR